MKNHWKSAVHFIQRPINREIIISWTETFVKSAMTFNESEKVTLLIGSHGINVMRWCLAITRCVCLPSSSCVHGLKLSFGRRPRPPEVCGWADGKYGRFGCTASAATMGTTSYSSPFDTLITGPAEADTTSFLSITSLGLLSSILWLRASKGLI